MKTFIHLIIAVSCFYIGIHSIRGAQSLPMLWIAVGPCFIIGYWYLFNAIKALKTAVSKR